MTGFERLQGGERDEFRPQPVGGRHWQRGTGLDGPQEGVELQPQAAEVVGPSEGHGVGLSSTVGREQRRRPRRQVDVEDAGFAVAGHASMGAGRQRVAGVADPHDVIGGDDRLRVGLRVSQRLLDEDRLAGL